MKKITTVLAVILLTSTLAIAQRGGQRGPEGRFLKDLSVEQLATLKTKRMTLALDLTAKQQQQLMKINLVEAELHKTNREERKAKRKSDEFERPTAEERFALENERLDRMIARQEELRNILNDEQYDLWKKMQMRRHHDNQMKMKRERRRR